MNFFVEYLAELGLESGKKQLHFLQQEHEIKKSIIEYIERQKNINEMFSLAEEIDFQGIVDYLLSDMLEDVKVYLFGKEEARNNAKQTILSKAYDKANANNDISKSKVNRLVGGAIDILYYYYRNTVPDGLWLIKTEIEDVIQKKLNIHEDNLVNKMGETVKKSVKEALLNSNGYDVQEKYINNQLLNKVHDFVMQHYVKEKYRNNEISEDEFNKYSELFKLIISIQEDEKSIEISKNIFDFVREDIISKRKNNLIKVIGPDGMGKSTFLSILYIFLYKFCEENGFSFYPFYINLHYYDKIIKDEQPDNLVKEKIEADLDDFYKITKECGDIQYIIIIDGNENYFRTPLKSGKYFREFIDRIIGHKKIVCIGEMTSAYINREKKNYLFMQSRMQYTFRFKPIHRYEEDKWKNFVKIFAQIENNDSLLSALNKYLKKFELDEVDLNILNIFKECYDEDLIEDTDSISDLYQKYCMAYLGDPDDFEDCAKMSFQYFLTKKSFELKEISGKNKEWNLIHQHKSVSNFLVAYHFVKKFKEFDGKNGINELECLFPMDINVFIKPIINENIQTQTLVIKQCQKVYCCGGILAKSQAVYMMGRITSKNLRNDILSTLEKYYQELYTKIPPKGSQRITDNERNIHFILRSVIISLVYLGKKDKREVYLEMLLNYPVANQINRGFHLEYYGDMPKVPNGKVYYTDDGTSAMGATYEILINRIKRYLISTKGTEDLNFQINLFTLCSLIQVRLDKNVLFDSNIANIKEIIDLTLQREQNSINKDFKAYLTMLIEDIEQATFKPKHLYEKLYGLKSIVRSGWVKGIQNDIGEKRFENVVEHIYYTWMLGMLYLPEEAPEDSEYIKYNKRKILDAILIHDWAEIDVGDAIPEDNNDIHKELEDFRMRVLLMHDTYSFVGNMFKYKEMWEVYKKDSPDINGRIAYELDKIQAIYQFYMYLENNAKFSDEKIKSWLSEKNNITTSIGQKILQEVVLDRFERNK